MTEDRILPANGITRRIYIDPYELKEGGQPIRVLEGEIKNPIWAAGIIINGPSELVFSPVKPLWSDARLWIETESELVLTVLVSIQ